MNNFAFRITLLIATIFLNFSVFAQSSKPQPQPIPVKSGNQDDCNQANIHDTRLCRLKSAMEVSNPKVRKFAVELAKKYPGKLNYGQIFNIYDHLWKNWKYVSDPKGKEYFSSSSESIDFELAGDCDDFAILLAALLENVGAETRINFAYNSEDGHAFTEIYIGRNSEELQEEAANAVVNHYKDRKHLQGTKITIGFRISSDDSLWLNLDYFTEYAGGPYFKYTENIIYCPTKGIFKEVTK